MKILLATRVLLQRRQARLSTCSNDFAEQLTATSEVAAAVKQVNAEVGVECVVVSERRQEEDLLPILGANAEALREAARRLNIPADVIVELGESRFTPGPELIYANPRGLTEKSSG